MLYIVLSINKIIVDLSCIQNIGYIAAESTIRTCLVIVKRSFQVTELSKGLGRGRVMCIAWPRRKQQQSITASRVRDFILQVDVWIHWWFLLGRLLFLADEIWSACCDSRAFIFSCFVPVITTTSLWYRLFTFSVIPQPLHLSLSGQADL